ncbi:sensor histidine kinase [Klugiella xanthotipulae]|uniref:histidine kinase n=1 Tax=Klugiella xanthotipulae TaxID=244735 RepID=A0A543I4G2_9MICO|nr:sensor domain-containing protein [Klugiella xanthotipulae]TQM65449.1 signal transduction histidine kinase [Klugiella xanthotipulae]
MNTTQPHAPTTARPSALAEHLQPRATYGELWRRTPAALGYLLPTIVIAVGSLALLTVLFSLSLSLALFVAGLYLGIGMFATARWFGTVELARLEAAGMAPISRPVWPRLPAGGNVFRQVCAQARNGHYWLYLLHGMIVGPIVMIFTWSLTISAIAVALAGSTVWAWGWALPDDRRDIGLVIVEGVPGFPLREPLLVSNLVNLALGLVVLVCLPWILHGMMRLQRGLAAAMLGRFRSDDLAAEVENLAASRSAAVSAENVGLRRLERDIHDGPQQRLIRLQMDLAATERMLDSNPDRARVLLTEARTQARDTLEELRALSRGFAPPLLQDRGLAAALVPLAARNGIPTTLESGLPDNRRLAPEVELGAYFVIAELLSNTTKHSGANEVTVVLALIGSSVDTALSIAVMDNGTGGATFAEGHGLSGLRERVTGLRGSIRVASPAGGPTTVTVVLPLPA